MQTFGHGGDIYTTNCRLDFSVNINPAGTPAGVKEALRRAAELVERYPDPQCGALRRAMSVRYRVPEEWLLFSNGAAELIFALALAVRPRRAVLAEPCFAEYERALSAAGCGDIRHAALSRECGFALTEAFADAIPEGTELVFLCNPSNPAGRLTERAVLTKILERCEEIGAYLVLDECFLELTERPEAQSLLARTQTRPRLIVLRAFTKTYAMPGVRLGWGVCADEMLREKIRACLQPWSVSVPAQEAGLAALAEDDWLEKTRALIAGERQFLRTGMEGLGLRVFDSAANYLLFEGPEELGARCLREGILIRDCSNYRTLRRGDFRVAVRRREENEELLRVLQAARTE